MSNSRQFLVPSNYDVTKEIYPREDIVRKRQYLIDEINSTKQYLQNPTHENSTEANAEATSYADKLRRRAK